MKENKLNLIYHTCIFDHFVIPENNDWMYELKRKKEEQDKIYNNIKKILTK